MPLEAGAKLGTYEIIAQLGAGGMGEVYRARDTRLERIVAIKVLPPSLVGERGRRVCDWRAVPLFRVLGRSQISSTDLYTYDVTRDGQKFIVNRYVKPHHVDPLTILLHAGAAADAGGAK
jgi:serine/threonine protein kinase